MDKVLDKRGTEVNIGDTIAYGAGRGYIEIGKIVAFVEASEDRYDWQRNSKYEVLYAKIKVDTGGTRTVTIDSRRKHYVRLSDD